MLRHKRGRYANDTDSEVPFLCWIGIHGSRFYNFNMFGSQTVCNDCLLILKETS